MTTLEIKSAIRNLADQCDESPRQQAIKGLLCAVSGSVVFECELELLCHVAEFVTSELERRAEWPDEVLP